MWARVGGVAVGVWLMCAPQVLGLSGAQRVNDLIVGPLAAATALIAVSEATRAVRWVGLPLGLWQLAAAWLLGSRAGPALADMMAGVLLAACALVRGPLHRQLGGGWRALL